MDEIESLYRAWRRMEAIPAGFRETVIPAELFDALVSAVDEPGEIIEPLRRAVGRAEAVTVRR